MSDPSTGPSAVPLAAGRRGARAEFVVRDDDTAAALGSGALPVLGTPRLLAWCEQVTCVVADDLIAAEREPGTPRRTSVGTRVSLEHLAASGVGERVLVEAGLEQRDGRLLSFAVTVTAPGRDAVLATAQVRRVVVDEERFLGRLGPASG